MNKLNVSMNFNYFSRRKNGAYFFPLASTFYLFFFIIFFIDGERKCWRSFRMPANAIYLSVNSISIQRKFNNNLHSHTDNNKMHTNKGRHGIRYKLIIQHSIKWDCMLWHRHSFTSKMFALIWWFAQRCIFTTYIWYAQFSRILFSFSFVIYSYSSVNWIDVAAVMHIRCDGTIRPSNAVSIVSFEWHAKYCFKPEKTKYK